VKYNSRASVDKY